MLVSPSEPEPLKQLGKVSGRCEETGSDFLLNSVNHGLVGVQRKEVSDLVHSFYSGRLSKQLMKMRGSVGQGVLLIEGKMEWSSEGMLVAREKWSISQHLAVIAGVQSTGFWTLDSTSLHGTGLVLSWLETWLSKKAHSFLTMRPAPDTQIPGYRSQREWGIHLLQGLEGVGPGTAAAIYDHFQGVPLKWSVGEKEMLRVAGVGPKTVKRLTRLVGSSDAG